MGMGGVATASRVSPDTSMRGHGGYASDYRSYNRGGFGRGQSRNFHRSQPLPQKGGDIFMEAGRLATEFLVSKGLLPGNVLSGKWQNDSLKNQVVSREGDGMHSLEGRTSALSRLGGPVSDVRPDRTRYPDEYNSIGSRSYGRGRRRNGSFKNYGADWSREFGRSGSWSERSRPSADVDGDSDAFSRHPDDQQVSNDGDSVSQNSPPESAPENDVSGFTESALEKPKSVDDVGAKVSSSSNIRDMDTNLEPKEKDDVIQHAESGEINDGENNDEVEPQETKNELAAAAGSEVNSTSMEINNNLLKLCSFAKVPTRPRSSVSIRSSKVDPDPMVANDSRQEREPLKESRASVEDLTGDSLAGNDLSKYSSASKILDSDSSKVEPSEVGLGTANNLVEGNSGSSISFQDRSLKEKINEFPEFEKANTLMDRGEKRTLDDDFTLMASKKPRELAPSKDGPSDGCLHLSDSLEKQQTPKAPITSEVEAVTSPNEKRLLDMSLYPRNNIEPCTDFTEEKELFPGSFKTCDLNLIETSDVHESHSDHDLMFPSAPPNEKQEIPVDIDLTVSNNSRVSDKYGKDIEVIDLESYSVPQDKDFNDLERRPGNVFRGLDGYSSNVHNASDIHDAQDGYGLMFSELLGNDIPNCSSVPPDLNTLHNDMGLHNGEGILGDDESIYMSLGEIPLSLLRVWEQPSQDYGKPF